ncbi:excinuclease ABC subunit A [Ferrimonas sp. SCSIO 43195]|uniref:excinuclease ABC subunit A n=1 Tax=Ferrimonas sp. SCSIO 43195 TaxID=2822844 RepID=UPI0020763252|nr:excinuclease ABC subunit A [Ferrimonas sp. SCSIO 43195]USD39014.1 excinuclease ABC subunit A [Ferrimonas sp. SCSIO 43195]
MKNTLCTAALLASTVLVAPATMARDDLVQFDIQTAMEHGKEKQVLNDSIKMVFGEEHQLTPVQEFGEFTSNKKTNAFAKSDQTACNWAFLSAVKSLQERAVKSGGNAVINIRSYYKKNDFRSATEFQCGAGTIMAGVTLVGDVVKL